MGRSSTSASRAMLVRQSTSVPNTSKNRTLTTFRMAHHRWTTKTLQIGRYDAARSAGRTLIPDGLYLNTRIPGNLFEAVGWRMPCRSVVVCYRRQAGSGIKLKSIRAKPAAVILRKAFCDIATTADRRQLGRFGGGVGMRVGLGGVLVACVCVTAPAAVAAR